ncbi:hypothetical protein CVT25_007006 [Psilocybe cyanescens]|uniref:Uncharacterized protein n=1 Tax=Psilocybe cyanescens TaxID=93625 RepID=A0A409WYE7_PSICY|nr:hypothetical protein CVT25_007006 [Psilocybe cyanescens]
MPKLPGGLRRSEGSFYKRFDEASEPSLHRELSFNFNPSEKDKNPVFDKFLKPIFQGKHPNQVYSTPCGQKTNGNINNPCPFTTSFSHLSSATSNLSNNKSLSGSAKVTDRSSGPVPKEDLVNGLSRWATVSSLNSEGSFFLEGNLHSEKARDHDINPTIDEEDEEMWQSESEDVSDSEEHEPDSQQISEDFDYDRPRRITPSSSFSYVGVKSEGWVPDTDGETTAVELEDREKTPTCSSYSLWAYEDVQNTSQYYYSLSAPVARPYKTRSGQIPPEKTKFRNPHKRRNLRRTQSANPY